MSGTPFGKLAAAKAQYVVSIVHRSVMPQATYVEVPMTPDLNSCYSIKPQLLILR